MVGQKDKQNCLNNNLLVGIIVALFAIIVIMGFFLGKMSGNKCADNADIPTTNITSSSSSSTSSSSSSGGNDSIDNNVYETLTIKVIKDDRDASMDVQALIDSFGDVPSVQNANMTILDFQDAGVQDYMIENDIKFLPAIVFSTNNFDSSMDPQTDATTGMALPQLKDYLQVLPGGEYELLIGANYDPFAERSERGFKILNQEQYDEVMKDVYIQGDSNAKITWIEYSDLGCYYCKKLYDDGTPQTIREKYGNDVNIVFAHFAPRAPEGAQILECFGEQKGSDGFYSLLEKAFAEGWSDKDDVIAGAVDLGANKEALEKCLEENTYLAKVNNQMQMGGDYFGVDGTPGNILINRETLEYDLISGAYPAEYFEDLIDRLK